MFRRCLLLLCSAFASISCTRYFGLRDRFSLGSGCFRGCLASFCFGFLLHLSCISSPFSSTSRLFLCLLLIGTLSSVFLKLLLHSCQPVVIIIVVILILTVVTVISVIGAGIGVGAIIVAVGRVPRVFVVHACACRFSSRNTIVQVGIQLTCDIYVSSILLFCLQQRC